MPPRGQFYLIRSLFQAAVAYQLHHHEASSIVLQIFSWTWIDACQDRVLIDSAASSTHRTITRSAWEGLLTQSSVHCLSKRQDFAAIRNHLWLCPVAIDGSRLLSKARHRLNVSFLEYQEVTIPELHGERNVFPFKRYVAKKVG